MKLFAKYTKISCKICLALAVVGCLAIGTTASWAQNDVFSNQGHINHNNYTKGQTASCTVEYLPETEREFNALQSKVSTEPQGAVMCFLAAMNVYVHNEDAGLSCLRKASYRIGSGELSTLKQKLRGPESDPYVQKFLPFAHLKGATPENGYKPTQPLTLEVSVNNGVPYSILTAEDAPIIYLNFKTNGTDMGQRSVSVIRPYDSDYYVVYDRAGLMMQVQNIKRPKRPRDLED